MAERALSAAMLAAIDAGTVRPFVLYEGEYLSGGATAYLRLFTGVGTLSWDGKDWTGGRDLLAISPIRESTSLEAIGFSVRLSGLPADKLSLFLQSMRKNKAGRLWLGFFDAAAVVIVDPYPQRRGRFDVAPITRDPGSGTVTIEARYEGPLARLLIPIERHYTHEDQQLRLAGDKGFDQVEALQDTQDLWGPEVPVYPVTGRSPLGPSEPYSGG
jgi:hypothetical protein